MRYNHKYVRRLAQDRRTWTWSRKDYVSILVSLMLDGYSPLVWHEPIEFHFCMNQSEVQLVEFSKSSNLWMSHVGLQILIQHWLVASSNDQTPYHVQHQQIPRKIPPRKSVLRTNEENAESVKCGCANVSAKYKILKFPRHPVDDLDCDEGNNKSESDKNPSCCVEHRKISEDPLRGHQQERRSSFRPWKVLSMCEICVSLSESVWKTHTIRELIPNFLHESVLVNFGYI